MNPISNLIEAFNQLEAVQLALRESLATPGWERLEQCAQALELQCASMQKLMQELAQSQADLLGLEPLQKQALRERIAFIQQLQEINQELVYLGMERAEQMLAKSPRLSQRARYGRGGRWVQDASRHLLAQG